MTGAYFPEPAHARHSSARNGEAQRKTLQLDKVRRRETICRRLLRAPSLRESAESPPSPPVPVFTRAWPPRECVGGTWRSFYAGNFRARCVLPVLAFVCQGQPGPRGGRAAAFRGSCFRCTRWKENFARPRASFEGALRARTLSYNHRGGCRADRRHKPHVSASKCAGFFPQPAHPRTPSGVLLGTGAQVPGRKGSLGALPRRARLHGQLLSRARFAGNSAASTGDDSH